MPLRVIQFRGGTVVEHELFVGHDREITVNTTNNRIRVHDGTTPGGHELANQLENDVYRSSGNLTKLSQLTPDVQYLKQAELTKLSQLQNDKGYIAGHCTYCTHCGHCTHCS